MRPGAGSRRWDDAHYRLIEPMSRPIVAIVGRPNVGKSTLFNRMLGWRKAIVDAQSGLTRDRLYGVAEWRGREFTVVDTAGLDLDTAKDASRAAIEAQTQIAIDQADVIVLLLDVRRGLTPIDRDIAQLLRKSRRRVIVAANKADSPNERHFAHEILELGFDEPSLISAQHGLGVGALLDRVLESLPAPETLPPAADGRKTLASKFEGARYAPVVTVSAKTREGIGYIMPAALEVVEQRRVKMPPNELNKVLREAFQLHPPPSYKGRRLKVTFGTQA